MIGSAIVRESRLAWSREKRAPAGGGQGDAVARDARCERRRLGDAEREPVGRRRLAAPALLWAGVGGEHRGGAGEQAVGGRPRAAQVPLDRPLELVADDRRRQEGERQDDGAAPVEGRAAPRRSGVAGRSISAAAAPACRATSKLLRTSGSTASQSQPASQGTRTMWAELETGSSSVGPWTMPSASARPAGIPAAPSPLNCPASEPPPGRPEPRARRRPDRHRAAASARGRRRRSTIAATTT